MIQVDASDYGYSSTTVILTSLSSSQTLCVNANSLTVAGTVSPQTSLIVTIPSGHSAGIDIAVVLLIIIAFLATIILFGIIHRIWR